jgi:hypothetical protein
LILDRSGGSLEMVREEKGAVFFYSVPGFE